VAAAGAGAYWYYTHPDEVADAQKKAKAQEEELKKKAKDLELSGKAKAEGLYKEGQAKIDQAKVHIRLLSLS
jgi:hypothetical protein